MILSRMRAIASETTVCTAAALGVSIQVMVVGAKELSTLLDCFEDPCKLRLCFQDGL